MCRHSGKTTKDFCKQTDEKIIESQFFGLINKMRDELCTKKYGFTDGYDFLNKKAYQHNRDDNTKAEYKKAQEINDWAYAQDEYIIKNLPFLIDGSVKKTADYCRMRSKVGSALAKLRNDLPTKESYELLAGIVELLASKSNLATWDDVEKPRLKK